MIHNERTLEVEATPEEVWAVLGRFMHIDEFHPRVDSVEALTTQNEGVGAKRHCNFSDGTSVDEEVVEWVAMRRYRVRLSDFSMPLAEAYAELSVEPTEGGKSRTKMAMDYRVKFGPLGWLMGQTMIKRMTGQIFESTLQALEAQVRTSRATSS